MFYGATSFNQNIGDWNTNFTAMARMFEKATRFDQDLSKWNVSELAIREMHSIQQLHYQIKQRTHPQSFFFQSKLAV